MNKTTTNRLFDGIGQDHLYRKINRISSSQKLGSAYLFAGPRGAGKMHMALHFFASMNCQNPHSDGYACGECTACKKTLSFSHPNLQMIYAVPRNPGKDYSGSVDPVALMSEKQYDDLQHTLKKFYSDPYETLLVPGAGKILLSSIKSMKKKLSLKSEEPGWQFVVISLMEMANIESFNSLLKILEEPPTRTTFILTTEKLFNLPDTIRSRCQIIKFNPVAESAMLQFLKNQGSTEEDARLISRLANGNVNKIKNYRSLEFAKNKNEFLQLWRNIMAGNMIPISAKVKALALMVKSDRNSFEDFFRMMMYWFRDAQSLDAGATLEKLILFQFQDEIQKFATYYHGSDYYNLILKAEQVIELSAKNLYIPALVSHFFVTIQKELQQARMRSR